MQLRRTPVLLCGARIGQGPHSATVRNKNRTTNLMENVQLATNLNLRLSLAGLSHPSEVQHLTYKSPEWRMAMVRLFRAILRLHNKTVAVSLEEAKSDRGPQSAVSSVVQGKDPKLSEDYIIRYLLTPAQQEFGNRFVIDAFRQHSDADRMSTLQFYEGWYQYVLQLSSGVTDRDLTPEEVNYLSEEQKEQLNQIRNAFLSMREEQEPTYRV